MQYLLDDDSLCEIFRYLSVKDQLCLSAVCERFRELLVECIWRVEFSKFTSNGDKRCEKLNNTEYQTLYRLLAPHIRELTIDNTTCVAFTSYLGRYTTRPELAFYLHFEYPKLRVLRCYDQSLHGGHVASLARKCPQLKSLHVTSSYVNGEHIAEMRQLRELYLGGNKLEPLHLGKILQMPQLTRLHLAGQVTDVRAMEAALSPVLPYITELRQYDNDQHIVTRDYFNENVLALRKLKILYCKRLTDFICVLQSLRELHFEDHVELNELLQIIENNPHLDQLYLSLNFGVLSVGNWVCDLVDLAQRQGREQILTIHLDFVQKIIQQLKDLIEERCQRNKVPIKLKKLSTDLSHFPILINKTGIEFALATKE